MRGSARPSRIEAGMKWSTCFADTFRVGFLRTGTCPSTSSTRSKRARKFLCTGSSMCGLSVT